MLSTKYKLIVFDLDDTILDSSKELLHIANTPFFYERIKDNLPTLPGAIENLKYLSAHYTLVLVTQGNPEVQKQKIETLKISSFFKKVYIASSAESENKQKYFQAILNDFKVAPHQCLSIGNRRATDIRLAKREAFDTCLFLYGEHMKEAPEAPEDIPDYEFTDHRELLKICQL